MTDAFRCNGCDEYYDHEFRFVSLQMDVDAVSVAEFTLDDLPTAAYRILEDDHEGGNEGDLCTSCGFTALATLVDLFEGSETR